MFVFFEGATSVLRKYNLKQIVRVNKNRLKNWLILAQIKTLLDLSTRQKCLDEISYSSSCATWHRKASIKG